ncbi:LysR family transcriptional regulator [Shewanella sp.]|uniref:LysR family transcriptional regulator n=1 Tax=Shewanella sp. TaxID=50422 RepID=UPI003A97E863
MNKLLRSMRVFTATVDLGSMKAAAEQLNMSTSAVSQQIQKMEQRAGVVLLNRTTRKLTLTDVGLQVYDNCCRMIALAEQTEALLSNYRQLPSGVLKLSAPAGFGGHMLSEPIRHLQNACPDIHLDLSLQDTLLDPVREGIDIAIQIGPLKDSSLYAHHLCRWRVVLCVAPSYLELQRLKLPSHPSHLLNWQRIGHSQFKGRFSTLRHSRQRVFELPPSQFDVNNMQALQSFVVDGLGYGALPEPDAIDLLRQGRLVRVLPEWQLPEGNAYALTQSRVVPPKVRQALNILKACFARYEQLLAA